MERAPDPPDPCARPLVSVVVPTFDRRATVRRAVDSVLAQTWSELEVIVVDDGSRDGTARALEDHDERVRVLRQANAGPSAARNHGVREARGTWVAFLDSDDVWRPTKLERQMRALLASGASCSICDAEIHGADGRRRSSFEVAGLVDLPGDGLLRNPFALLATRFVLFNQVLVVRRALFLEVGGYDEDLRLLEDYDLALRLACHGPWALTVGPLVDKDDTTRGIGVVAMDDAATVLPLTRRILAHTLACGGGELPAGPLLRRSHHNHALACRALAWMGSRHAPLRSAGSLLLSSTRVRRALWRRLPSWPRAEVEVMAR